MKTAAETASKVLEGAKRSASQKGLQSQTASPPVTRSTDKEVLEIWKRMGAIYGYKWTSSYGEEVDSLWRRAMQSLPVDRLKVALGRMAKRPDAWPPSLPEFLALAKVTPEEVGAPDFDAAWKEATNRSPHSDWIPWSHRCVYWAATWTGQTDLHERGQYMHKAFDREYQRALEQADSLAEPPLGRLPSKTSKQVQAEREQAASEHLPDIKAMVRGW